MIVNGTLQSSKYKSSPPKKKWLCLDLRHERRDLYVVFCVEKISPHNALYPSNPHEGYGYMRGTIFHTPTCTLMYPSHIPARVYIPVSITTHLWQIYCSVTFSLKGSFHWTFLGNGKGFDFKVVNVYIFNLTKIKIPAKSYPNQV